ncbi:hypothetical protein M2124_000239 [Polynucleobacter sphagniphilus]|uniref:hypothetical protein n=1 Tax=Polynucleobacter sphagniphilus TaxID=1743169 RepID=UPI0024764B31|nr:hypothetical protein [Polynucleobacter sphagniphilus]MDH6153983.1 hypothetical protein [Polynucleobacter sphagniphilus]
MKNRFLIDYANPDAGIGHSMGFINRAIKIADRNKLLFAYSETQLLKSADSSWGWRLKQILRTLRGRKQYETHNLGNDLNHLLGLQRILPSRDEVELKIKKGELRSIDLPFPEFPVPSIDQIDDEAYKLVDQFIQSHPESNIVFKLNNKNSGDYEYGATREWFMQAYAQARTHHPIALDYQQDKLNVAVHIRRGDLLPGRQYADLSSRMLPDYWYLNLLSVLMQSTSKKLAIHIYSEGKAGQYYSEMNEPFSWCAHLKDSGHEVYEHIDESFMSTFHHLLFADILIGSKSGMTHLAGMLGKQMKLVPKMWHSYRGAKNVIEVADDIKEFDKEHIKILINKHLKDLGKQAN